MFFRRVPVGNCGLGRHLSTGSEVNDGNQRSTSRIAGLKNRWIDWKVLLNLWRDMDLFPVDYRFCTAKQVLACHRIRLSAQSAQTTEASNEESLKGTDLRLVEWMWLHP